MNLTRHLYFDKSTDTLILSNIVTIGFAVVQKWDVSYVMQIYWWQSVIIGLFNWKRILDLKKFSTKDFRINNQPVQPTRVTKLKTAWFFLFHYGFFHFVYFVFLFRDKEPLSNVQIISGAACILMFTINHGFSYLHNRDRDSNRTPNIGTLMIFPYARIIPMHLTIIIGNIYTGNSLGTLVLFLGLKTIADVIMHMVEHSEARC